MNILVIGSTGFVGVDLVDHLIQLGHKVFTASRQPSTDSNFYIPDINESTNWSFISSLSIDCVFHLAARVHQPRKLDSYSQYLTTNYFGLINLYKNCQFYCVKYFIYLSTAKIHGEFSAGRPFTEESIPCPQGPYAVSKYLAEQYLLHSTTSNSITKFFVVRPPLVYGRGARGNLHLLAQLCRFSPLVPFANISNSRSLISKQNLVCFLGHILNYVHLPSIHNQVFLVSDGYTLSTSSVVESIIRSVKSPCFNFYFPPFLVFFLCFLIRKEHLYIRLYNSFALDTSKAGLLLNWRPVRKDNPEFY